MIGILVEWHGKNTMINFALLFYYFLTKNALFGGLWLCVGFVYLLYYLFTTSYCKGILFFVKVYFNISFMKKKKENKIKIIDNKLSMFKLLQTVGAYSIDLESSAKVVKT